MRMDLSRMTLTFLLTFGVAECQTPPESALLNCAEFQKSSYTSGLYNFPKFPDIKSSFAQSLSHVNEKYRMLFEDFIEENTEEQNCNCNHDLLIDRLDLLNNGSLCNEYFETDCTLTTTVIPTTTTPETTTSVLTTTAFASTSVEVSPTTSIQYKEETTTTEALSSSTSSSIMESTEASIAPAKTDTAPITSPIMTTQTESPNKSSTGTFNVLESSIQPIISSTPTASSVVQKSQLPEATAVLIGVCAGVVAMVIIAGMFALCRKRCACTGLQGKHSMARRQRSDRRHLSLEENDMYNSQPPTPRKEKPDGDFICFDKSSTGSGESGVIFNEKDSQQYSTGTLKALDMPHALYYGGFGESTTETLPKKKSVKKRESSKRKSNSPSRRKSAASLSKKKNKTRSNGDHTDSNFNSWSSMPSSAFYGDVANGGQMYLNYENETRSVTPDAHSVTTLISRDEGSTQTGENQVSPDELIGQSNAYLFAYDNPAMDHTDSGLDQSDTTCSSPSEDSHHNVNGGDNIIPAPAQFTSPDPVTTSITPDENSDKDSHMEDEDGMTQGMSVKERASFYENTHKLSNGNVPGKAMPSASINTENEMASRCSRDDYGAIEETTAL